MQSGKAVKMEGKKQSADSKEKKNSLSVGAVISEPGSTVRNKTGTWRTMKPTIDEKKCIKCGLCWTFCPDSAISAKIKINYDYCKGCGICVKNCPVQAIAMEKEKK
jgi:2-oxoacid:acceptor oxidoreductase delta subunit (pyruvate/2-ketoisovalerate family)